MTYKGWQSIIFPGMCNHALDEARQELGDKYDVHNLVVEYHHLRGEGKFREAQQVLEQRQEIDRTYRIEAEKRFSRLCIHLGPEEGAFYSAPYCIECLAEMIKAMREMRRIMNDK